MTSSLIGPLRHSVTIERPERTAEDGGGASISWVAVASVFARIEAASGREITLADGLILVAPDAFIHAVEGAPVCEVPLAPWWRRRIAGAFSFPGARD